MVMVSWQEHQDRDELGIIPVSLRQPSLASWRSTGIVVGLRATISGSTVLSIPRNLLFHKPSA